MTLLESLKTLALFLIAAALFTLSWVFYDVMGKHSRYVAVDIDQEAIVILDTHTGFTWSRPLEVLESANPVAFHAATGRPR
ncbi:MAG: hypothetical protein WHT06_10915 [Desulfobacterales bacterium]